MTRPAAFAALLLTLAAGCGPSPSAAATDDPTPPAKSEEPPVKRDGFAQDRAPLVKFDGDKAAAYVKQLCDIGPRISGSAGMAKQQALLVKHFEACGAATTRQEFQATARSKPGAPVAMTNLVFSWKPELPKRVILCSHYDTRPLAHEEPARENWARPFVSANDGTSGVAIFMELANHLKDLPLKVGVDIVLFDGEEYVFDLGVPYVREGDKYFFGSEHFAATYDKAKPKLAYRYDSAILLDLCGAADARLAVEGFSWHFAPQLVREVWAVAAAQGAKSFKLEQGFARAVQVSDDHLALNEVGIPAVDIIDFDYPHWHKLTDTPDKVSAKQCAEVGNVLAGWLTQQK
jgi:glutaminyl-peptide cyclotransferase